MQLLGTWDDEGIIPGDIEGVFKVIFSYQKGFKELIIKTRISLSKEGFDKI